MRKFGFLVGFGAGYVLGARAGRDRYEQLRRLYDNVAASPGAQQAKAKARDAVRTGLEQAKDAATGGVSKVSGGKRDRRHESPPSGLSVAPPPT